MNIYYPDCGPMPYESIFTVYIKLSHSNFACLSDLAKRFGGNPSDEYGSRWRITWEVEKELGKKFLGLATHLPWRYAPADVLNSPMIEFTFCVECIKFGYHSVFNSINFHRVCPLHKRLLSVACDACRRVFFKGFTASHIPSISQPCINCGFQEIGLRREMRMRRTRGLEVALAHFGRAQADWYRKIYDSGTTESDYIGLYYQSDLARAELTGAGERLFRMLSPESLAGYRQLSSPSVFVSRFRTYLHERIYSADSTFDLSDYLRLHSQAEILRRVKERYLAKHEKCYEECSLLAGYPDGQSRVISLCPLALAFILLCLKASYDIWPTPGSDFNYSLTDPGCKKSLRYLTSWTYREAVLVFLTLLARLEYHVSKGKNFVVLCRPDVVYFPNEQGTVFLRATSYRFRSQCSSPLRKNLLSRNGSGGAFVVLCAARNFQTPEKSKIRELIV